jgi:hypothetical protein
MRRAALVLPLALAASTPIGHHPLAAYRSPLTVPAQAQAGNLDTPCTSADSVTGPSRDLYCLDLDAIPALEGVTATFELNRIPAAFGVNVSRDGRQIYAPVLRVTGLPEAAAFSPGARVWVAWMATEQLNPTRKLGVVGNGRHALAEVSDSGHRGALG